MSNTVSFNISKLPPKVTGGSVGKRVAKVLEGTCVSIAMYTDPSGDSQHALIQVKTSLTADAAAQKLRKTRISNKRCRIQKVPNGAVGDLDTRPKGNGQNNGRTSEPATPKLTPEERKEKKAKEVELKKAKELELRSDAEDLASIFHLHVNADDELLQRVTDREEMSAVFQNFLAGISSTERSATESRRLEAHVMSHLRQQRLLRSQRRGEKVFITLARMGGPGDFPTDTTVQSEQAKVVARMDAEQENKMGVEISGPVFEDIVVPIKGRTKFPFTITTQDRSNPNKVALTGIEIGGASRKSFSVENVVFPAVLTTPGSGDTFVLGLQPRRPAMYRCILRLNFEAFLKGAAGKKSSFEIVRYVKVRAGDAKVAELLKGEPMHLESQLPMKKSAFEDGRAKEVFNPPRQPMNGGTDVDPFKSMHIYKIPRDVRQLIVHNKLDEVLSKPENNLNSYAHFWSKITWASECQSHQDIKSFDMENIQMRKEGDLFVFTVPGLTEERPSVFRDDIVHFLWDKKLYRGCVNSTRQEDVLVEMHDVFCKTYNPEVDTVHVRFTLSRTIFRTYHDGITAAPAQMGEAMLLPTVKHVEECLSANRRRVIPQSLTFVNEDLNREQKLCVENIVRGSCRPIPSIIWGLPGTGKSTTIVEAVYQLARHESKPKILLVAPSNSASDLLMEKLSSHFTPTELRRVLDLNRSQDQLDDRLKPYAKGGLSAAQVVEEAMSSQIIVCTLSFAADLATFGVPAGHFDVLCVDEAGYATEPQVIAAASRLMDFQRTDDRVGQLILAGDPKQLGPVITSAVSRKFGMEVSYMERLMQRPVYGKDSSNKLPAPLITKLIQNYRSHPSILKLPNDLFYEGELVASGDMLTTHDMTLWEDLPNSMFPLLFHSIQGENLRDGDSPSWYNPKEATEAVKYAVTLANQFHPPVSQSEIGIITPFQHQAEHIRKALASHNLTDIMVGNVEAFQGRERRCIIISTVRSEPERVVTDVQLDLGLIENTKRFNCAITRATSLLLVIGDPRVMENDKKNWLPYLRYCRDNSAWVGEEWEEKIEKKPEVKPAGGSSLARALNSLKNKK